MVMFQPRHDQLGYPIEEACQVQVGDHQHHRKEQHDRADWIKCNASLARTVPIVNIRTAPMITAPGGQSSFPETSRERRPHSFR